MTPAASVGVGAVRVYQWTLRPFIGADCRFWPSCSDYAIEALRLHGAVKGTGMAAKRVLRCNPWNAGGVDPVPGSAMPTSAASEADARGSVGPGSIGAGSADQTRDQSEYAADRRFGRQMGH